MKQLTDSLAYVLLAALAILGMVFLMVIFTDFLLPGTWTHRITAVAFGLTVAILLPLYSIALSGFMLLVWRKANDSRFLVEMPSADEARVFARVPLDKRIAFVTFNEGVPTSIELPETEEQTRADALLYQNSLELQQPIPSNADDLLGVFLRQVKGVNDDQQTTSS